MTSANLLGSLMDGYIHDNFLFP